MAELLGITMKHMEVVPLARSLVEVDMLEVEADVLLEVEEVRIMIHYILRLVQVIKVI